MYIRAFRQLWKCVPESERREVYEDVVFNLAKKEKEENKAMRKRNMKVCVCVDLAVLT